MAAMGCKQGCDSYLEQERKSDNRRGEQPGRMEESVSNVLDAIPHQARVLIIEELKRRNPALLAELCSTKKVASSRVVYESVRAGVS